MIWIALGIISDKPGGKPSLLQIPSLQPLEKSVSGSRFSDVGLTGEAAMPDETGISVSNGRRHIVAQIDPMQLDALISWVLQ